MPLHLPFVASVGNYRMDVSLEGATYAFVVHWNDRDLAWYFSIFDAENNVVIHGVKIVLGTYLGRRSTHPLLLEQGVIVARDLSGEHREAGFDDIGTRVVVAYYPIDEVALRVQTRSSTSTPL